VDCVAACSPRNSLPPERGWLFFWLTSIGENLIFQFLRKVAFKASFAKIPKLFSVFVKK
jgi:hypothetical protein